MFVAQMTFVDPDVTIEAPVYALTLPGSPCAVPTTVYPSDDAVNGNDQA